MRSYKKVGNEESTYQYLGDKLVYEKRGNIEFEYGYNSFGNLAFIKYTNAGGTVNYYYIVCNSRGDVENIYNGLGELRAHYTYDSWDKVIIIKLKNPMDSNYSYPSDFLSYSVVFMLFVKGITILI